MRSINPQSYVSLFNKKMLPQNSGGWRSGSLKCTGRIWSILPRSCGNALRASASFGYPVLHRGIWQPPQDSHRRRQFFFGGMAKGLGAWEIRVALNHPWESEWGWSILFTSFHVFSCISVLHVLHAIIMASYLWLSNVRFFFTPHPVFWAFFKNGCPFWLGILGASRESTKRMGSQDLDTLVSS